MTPQAPLRASLALGGMFILASSLLVSAPVASAEPSTEAVETINDRYTTFGGESSLLGAPLGEAVDVAGALSAITRAGRSSTPRTPAPM